jgi:predicted amidohydrolase
VNRAGRDPHLEYAGGSVAFGPKGEVLGELGDGECVLSVEIDLAGLREWRGTFPAWKDGKL